MAGRQYAEIERLHQPELQIVGNTETQPIIRTRAELKSKLKGNFYQEVPEEAQLQVVRQELMQQMSREQPTVPEQVVFQAEQKKPGIFAQFKQKFGNIFGQNNRKMSQTFYQGGKEKFGVKAANFIEKKSWIVGGAALVLTPFIPEITVPVMAWEGLQIVVARKYKDREKKKSGQ